MGKPTAAYDIRGVREVIPFPELLAPRGSVLALGKIIEQLIGASPAERTNIGELCRQHVLARFSEDGVVRRLRALYREMGVGIPEVI